MTKKELKARHSAAVDMQIDYRDDLALLVDALDRHLASKTDAWREGEGASLVATRDRLADHLANMSYLSINL